MKKYLYTLAILFFITSSIWSMEEAGLGNLNWDYMATLWEHKFYNQSNNGKAITLDNVESQK